MSEVWVLNASPIITLAKIAQLSLLERLASELDERPLLCWLFVAVCLKIRVMSGTSPERARESLAESTLPDLPVDVRRFCAQHGLLRYLMPALDLVSRRFVLAERPTIEIEQDPETGDQWVTVDIVVCGTAEEFFDWYDGYTDAFVAAIPWPERDKIRLSYRLV